MSHDKIKAIADCVFLIAILESKSFLYQDEVRTLREAHSCLDKYANSGGSK